MEAAADNVRVVGRYALYDPIAAGGMASVHLGRLLGPVGFSRTVAIKRLHAQFASDPEFVSMFLDEARLAARVRHPNVVPTLDVVTTDGELFLVMEYLPGESLARLARASRESKEPIPLKIISAIVAGTLHGLHAAHEAKDEHGEALGIVHRDVSPQNVLVGTDGVARVLDFGVAKAAGRAQTTRTGQVKGKLGYMAPEHLRGDEVTRAADVYAAGVMLWELLAGRRLFGGDSEGAVVAKVLEGHIGAPSTARARGAFGSARGVASEATDEKNETQEAHEADETLQTLQTYEALDETVLRAVAMDPTDRFPTAREMALDIESKAPPATTSEVTEWLERCAHDVLGARAAMVAVIESSASLDRSPRDSHVESLLASKPSHGAIAIPSSPSASGQVVPPAPSSATRLDRPARSSRTGLGADESRPNEAQPDSDDRSSVRAAARGQETAADGGELAIASPTPDVTRGLEQTTPRGPSPSLRRPAPRRGEEAPSRARTGAIALVVLILLLAAGIGGGLAAMSESRGPITRPDPALLPPEPEPRRPEIATPASPLTGEQPRHGVNEPPALVPISPNALPNAQSGPLSTPAPRRPHPRLGAGPKGAPVPSASVSEAEPSPPVVPPVVDDCRPPFWYDAQGVKRYKPHCLEK